MRVIFPISTHPDLAGAVRRFFFVDARLGFSSQSQGLQAVQYVEDMSISIVLRRSPRDSIYVPQLTITWDGRVRESGMCSLGLVNMDDTTLKNLYFTERPYST